MGAGSGGGSSGNPGGLAANIKSLAASGKYKFDAKSNKFGKAGLGGAQVIKSDNVEVTANEFFDSLKIGADLAPAGGGVLATFEGESFALLRLKSKSGRPSD
jgi:hypothetical protein